MPTPVNSASLDWSAVISKASLMKEYQVWKSVDVLPTAANFAASFSYLATVTIQRDFDTTIIGDPTLYSDPGVDFSTHFYHYYILAVPWQGPSSKSNIAPLSTPPTAVTLSGAYNSSLNRNEMSWTASTAPILALAGYKLERSIDNGVTWTTIFTADNVTTTYNDTNINFALVNNYRYRVSAFNTIGVYSAVSNIVIISREFGIADWIVKNDVWRRSSTLFWTYSFPAGADVAAAPNNFNLSQLPIMPTYPVPTSGKYYFEVVQTSISARPNSGANAGFGYTSAANAVNSTQEVTGLGGDTVSYYDTYEGGTAGGILIGDGVTTQNIVNGSFVVNDVGMVAIDFAAHKVWFGKNGVWKGTGTQDPATGQGGFWPTDLTSVLLAGSTPRRWVGPWQQGDNSTTPETLAWRFKAANWTFTPPSGFGTEFVPFRTRGTSPDTTPNFVDVFGASFITQQFVPGVAIACNNVNAGRTFRSQVQRGGAASGKRYFEVTMISDSNSSGASTRCLRAGVSRSGVAGNTDMGNVANSIGALPSGQINSGGGNVAPYGATTYMTTVDARGTAAMQGGDTYMVACDFVNDRIYFGANGVWFASQDPTNPAHGAALPALGVTDWLAALSSDDPTFKGFINTGGIPFFQTMPTGYQAWDA